MKKVFKSIIALIYSPIVFFLYFVANKRDKVLIREDRDAYCKLIHNTYNNSLYGMCELFRDLPEYRSQLYYRCGKISYLFSWLIKGQTNLYIYTPNIGGGLFIQHGFSTIISAKSIGRNCIILQQVTIGWNQDKQPVIGNNVKVCAGAKVIGDVKIEDNVIIGANAVVVKDVSKNVAVGGVPAKILKHIYEAEVFL